MTKLFKMPRIVPKITWAHLTGFKREELSIIALKPKRRRRQTIKKILKDV